MARSIPRQWPGVPSPIGRPAQVSRKGASGMRRPGTAPPPGIGQAFLGGRYGSRGAGFMRACLVSLDGHTDIVLDRPLTLVGRHPGCDARIGSPRVSRHHCCLTTRDGAVEVRDLDSTNGTRINGVRVGSGRLRPGDELAIARYRYLLVILPPSGVSAIDPDRAPAPEGLRETDPTLNAPAGESLPDTAQAGHPYPRAADPRGGLSIGDLLQ
jgi:hypothetical protein